MVSSHSSHGTLWHGFITPFILGPFFMKSLLLNTIGKNYKVNSVRYVTLLHNHVMPALQEKKKHVLFVITFIQNSTPPHFEHESKTLMLDIFTEDLELRRAYMFEWTSPAPDLT